jgi:hypothetical protein
MAEKFSTTPDNTPKLDGDKIAYAYGDLCVQFMKAFSRQDLLKDFFKTYPRIENTTSTKWRGYFIEREESVANDSIAIIVTKDASENDRPYLHKETVRLGYSWDLDEERNKVKKFTIQYSREVGLSERAQEDLAGKGHVGMKESEWTFTNDAIAIRGIEKVIKKIRLANPSSAVLQRRGKGI